MTETIKETRDALVKVLESENPLENIPKDEYLKLEASFNIRQALTKFAENLKEDSDKAIPHYRELKKAVGDADIKKVDNTKIKNEISKILEILEQLEEKKQRFSEALKEL